MNRASSLTCQHCLYQFDDVEQTLSNYVHWSIYWVNMNRVLGRDVTPNVKGMICGPIREKLPTDTGRRTALLALAGKKCSCVQHDIRRH